MQANNSWNFFFSSNARHGADFLACVQALVGERWRDGRLQVLEVGCGDGGKALRLAESWPRAHVTGVDLSAPSIQQAERRRLASPARERLCFLRDDYLTLPLGRFDLIVADSVLQWLPGSDDYLFAKLAGELKPGGLLVFSLPYACLYNRLLTGLRHTLRLFRSRQLDRLIVALASRWHGRSFSPEFLRERLNYAYLLARRMGSPALEKALLERHRLTVQAVVPCAHASPGQYKHRLWCFHSQPPTPALLPERLGA